MVTRLDSLVFDAADPAMLARWWADALGWTLSVDAPDEATVAAPGPHAPGIPMVFGQVADPKQGKNRVHLDLQSASSAAQAALVDRLTRSGARHADIGQGSVPWVVLADPEGNELCVLDPRPEYADTGPVAAVVVDAADPSRLARFWSLATGWPLVRSGEAFASLRSSSGRGPFIEFVRVEQPKRVKNRLHLEVAPFASDDQAAEVARLQALGATPADVGQGDVSWVVLADPERNEFCVLTPR